MTARLSVIASNKTNEVVDTKVSVATHYEAFGHLVAVAERGSSLEKLISPRGVAIDSCTNQIYVVDCYARISIFSDNGEFLNTFSHENLESPWGIAIHRGIIYVTDPRKQSVFYFKLSEDLCLVASQVKRGSGIRQFNGPRGLTVSANGDVFVADCFNNRVQILDIDLQYQRQLSHYSMTQPYDVRLTSDEVYILSIKDHFCVHVFSHAGDKIRSIITSGSAADQVYCPSFFCLDSDRNLIISDCYSHTVKIFSKGGKPLHTIGANGNEVGMLPPPYGVALIGNFKLVISNFSSGLQIFYY